MQRTKRVSLKFPLQPSLRRDFHNEAPQCMDWHEISDWQIPIRQCQLPRFQTRPMELFRLQEQYLN